MVSSVLWQMDFFESKRTCHQVVQTSVWLISYSEYFAIVERLKTLITSSTFCYAAGSDKPGSNKNAPNRLLIEAAMVFRVHSRHAKLLLTY